MPIQYLDDEPSDEASPAPVAPRSRLEYLDEPTQSALAPRTRAPGGGSRLAQQAPERRAISPELAAPAPDPVTRTERQMSDLELALSGDAEMAPFSRLADKDAAEHLGKVVKRLPGNIKKSIGAQTTEMLAGAQELGADDEAQLLESEAASYDTGLYATLFPEHTKQYQKELRQRAKQAMERGNRAAAVGAEARLGEQEATPEDAGVIENAIQQGLTSAMVSAPAILATGPVAGSALLGAGTGAARRSELLAAGVPEEEANRSAAFQGSLEALTEFLPGEALVKKVPGFWKHVAEFLVTELPGENITTIAGMLDDYQLGLRDDLTLDDVLKAVRDTSLATVVGGGAQVGAAKTLQTIAEAANQNAEQRTGSAAPSLAPAEATEPVTPPSSVHVSQETEPPARKPKQRVEPTVGRTGGVGEGRQGEPTLHVEPGTAPGGGVSAGAGEAPRAARPAAPGAEEAAAGTIPPAQVPEASAESAAVRADLGKIQKGESVSPETVAQLEARKLVIRNEQNVPRLLPAGRRLLAERESLAAEVPKIPAGKPRIRPKLQPGNAVSTGRENPAAPIRRSVTPPGSSQPLPASKPRMTEEERLAAGRAAIANTERFQRDLDLARRTTNVEPTYAQAKAGTYTKGRLRFAGMPVVLENPKGSTRHGYDGEGNRTWSRTMQADYGYISKTEGADGDHVDVFLAGAPDTGKVFVVNQVHPDSGRFDEHKVILGAHTRQEAEKLYKAHYPKGWKGMGSMVELPTTEFRGWLAKGNTQVPLERRTDINRRAKVAEMSPEQMRSALLTHELTKIPNRRAYEESEKLPHQVAIDVDSLKWVNDNMGHESGNELLKAVAASLKDETPHAYHISGDEFVLQARNEAEAHATMQRVSKRLAGARVEVEMPDGKVRTVTGLGVSYGLGKDLAEADARLQTHKVEREKAGQRARRGEAPPGASERALEAGREDQAGRTAPEVTGAKFARRAKTTTKSSLEKEFINRDDAFWNVRFDDEAGISEFRDTGYSGVVCTGFACAIQRKLGKKRVTIRGFEAENNPKAVAAQDHTGHDFAIVDGRYIVDPWLTDIEGASKKGVFDLKDPTDAAAIERFYGDQSTWENMDDRVVQEGDYLGNGLDPEATVNNPNFQRWFEGSKVVDSMGNPLVMYHATRSDFSTFKQRSKGREIGFHFGDRETVEEMVRLKHSGTTTGKPYTGANIMPVYLAIKNPLRLTDRGNFTAYKLLQTFEEFDQPSGGKGGRMLPGPLVELGVLTQKQADKITQASQDPSDYYEHRARKMLIDALEAKGYDGLVYENKYEAKGSTSWVAFRPEQIKSAIGNRGTFDRKNPDIRFSRRPRFFSSVITATEGLQQNRATGEQWWNTIKSRPGVKPEELEWMGLKDWLDAHGSKPINKVEVTSFMYANQIRVNEALLGARPGATHDALDAEITSIQEDIHATGSTLHYDVGDGILLEVTYRHEGRTETYGDPSHEEVLNGAMRSWEAIPDPAIVDKLNDLRELTEQRARRDQFAAASAQYERYTLPGGTNYRELLLTLERPPLPEPQYEELTELPPGYEVIRDESEPSYLQYGVIPPGQTHARPMGPRWSTPREAIADAIRTLNTARRDQAEQRLMEQREAQTFRSSHFTLPNILAHVRMKERVSHDGKPMLFIEEVQSDWHQKGRKEGYRDNASEELRNRAEALAGRVAEMQMKINGILQREDNLGFDNLSDARRAILDHADWADRWEVDPENVAPINEYRALVAEYRATQKQAREGVPDAPFKTTWPELAMKRVIRWAAEHGFERIGWTTGRQQARRYNLSSVARILEWGPSDRAGQQADPAAEPFGRIEVQIDTTSGWLRVNVRDDGRVVAGRGGRLGDQLVGHNLSEVIGDELTRRVLTEVGGRIEGMDLDVGGEGMVGFYDQILPRTVEKLIRKWGGKVGKSRIETSARFFRDVDDQTKGGEEIHAFDVTPAMKEAALAGQPLFTRTDSQAFKKWFGKSRVVDEEGKPLVVYHGSGTSITKFDYRFTDQGNDQLGSGFYFTTSESDGLDYTTRLLPGTEEKLGGMDNPTNHAVYLSIQKPLDANRIGTITKKQVREIIEMAPEYDYVLQNWSDDLEEAMSMASEAYAARGVRILGQLDKLANDFFRGQIKEFNNAVRHVLGYDGVFDKFSPLKTHWVAWFPEQIKSVDNRGDWDAKSQDIYSRRGEPGRGLHHGKVREIVRRTLLDAGFTKFPAIQIVQSYRELPPALRQQLEREEATESTGAIFMPGQANDDQIYLIASNNASELEVMENLFHEGVGHFGIRQIMDIDRYEEITDGIWRDMPDRVREAAQRNSLDVKDLDQRRAAAEEVIAYAAGEILTGQAKGEVRSLWKRIVDAVRSFFARIRGKEYFTEKRIAELVLEAKRALESQADGVHKTLRQGAMRSTRAPLYYSQLWQEVNGNKVPNQAPPAEYAKIIRSKGGKEVKPEELEWSGVPAQLESLTYGDLLEWSKVDSAAVMASAPDELKTLIAQGERIKSWLKRVDENKGHLNSVDAGVFATTTPSAFTREMRDEASALGFGQPTFEALAVAMQEELFKVTGQLDVAPKRIPKSLVLQLIELDQIAIKAQGPLGDDDHDWIGRLGDDDGELIDPPDDYVSSEVEARMAGDPHLEDRIRNRARSLVRNDDSYWHNADLDAEDFRDPAGFAEWQEHENTSWGLLTESGQKKVLEAAREDAEKEIEKGIEEEVREEEAQYRWTASDDSGTNEVTLEGSGTNGYEASINGEFLEERFESISQAIRALKAKADRLKLSDRSAVKWKEYTLPGGTEYGERVFTWENPREGMGYQSGHWNDDDVLLHLRYDHRETLLDGQTAPVLFLDELQSDWHQSVRDAKNDDRETRLATAKRNYQSRFFKYHEEEDWQHNTPQNYMLQFLKSLDLSAENFRKLMLEHARTHARDEGSFGYVYKWLGEVRQMSYSDLRPPGTPYGNTDTAPMEAMPLETWNWREFTNWLDQEDKQHEEDIDGALDRNDMQGWVRAVVAHSSVGGSWNAQGQGGIPPTARIAHAVCSYLPDYVPTNLVPQSGSAPHKATETWRLHWPSFTRDMAQTDEARKAFDALQPFQELYKNYLEAVDAAAGDSEKVGTYQEATRALLEKGDWSSMGSALMHIDRTLAEFVRGSNLPKIPERIPATASSHILEIGERSERLYEVATETAKAKRIPPLAKTWPLAALKWAIRHAAENGIRHIALAPGAVHGRRWNATQSYDTVLATRMSLTDAHELKARSGSRSDQQPHFDGPVLDIEDPEAEVIHLHWRGARTREQTATGPVVITTIDRLGGWVGDSAGKILRSGLEIPVPPPGQGELPGFEPGGKKLTQMILDRRAHSAEPTIWGPVVGATTEQMDIHHGSLEIYNSILPFMFNKFLGKFGAKIRPGVMPLRRLKTTQSVESYGLEPDQSHAFSEMELRDLVPADNVMRIARPNGFGLDESEEKKLPDWQIMSSWHPNSGSLAPAGEWREIARGKDSESPGAMLDKLYEQFLKSELAQLAARRVTATVPMIEIPPKLRDTALTKGFPLFARRWTHGARALGNAIAQGSNTFNSAQPNLRSRFWNYLVYKAQDKFIDLFHTQREVAAWRGAAGLPDAQDAYLKQTLYHGRVEKRIADYEKQFVEPLIEMIKGSGYEWGEVEDFLYARHAPEANARIRAINPNAPQFSSGMSDTDAAAIMNTLASTPNFQKLVAIGQHVDAMTKFSRDTMVMEGLEDPSVIAAWEQTYKAYVPLKGWANSSVPTELPKKGRGFDVGGKLTKMRTGRTSRAGTILANIVAQAQSTLILAEKAKVGRALYDFVNSTPAPDLWVVDQVEYMRFVDPNTGLVREGVNPTYKLADNVIRVRRNGQDYHITFNPESEQMVRLCEAMKNLNVDQIGPIFSILHGVNRYLSALNTSLNPEFVITNALRDMQTAMANLTEQQKSGIRTAVVRDWRKAWWGIRKGEGAPLSGKAGSTWAQHWDEFQKAGGKVGWIDHYKTPEDLEKKLRKHLTKDNVLTYSVKGLRAVLDFIENENLAVENAIRLSTFVNLQKAGLSTERAAEAAKNLTVNFNRKGDIGTVMNSLYLFYNASIQGTARLWQLAKHPKGRLVLGMFVAAGIAMDLLMRAISGDDDDKENIYDKVPDHEKERNIIIVPPASMNWRNQAGERQYIKLMLPYGFSTLYYSGTVMGKYFDYGFLGNVRRVNPGEDAGHVASAFLGSFSPIGDASGGLSQFLLPTLADPFVQLADNKTWWGGKITPEDFDEEAPSPDSTRFYRSVPVPYRDAASWLNHHTGGTEISPGYIDVAPGTLQHWVDFTTGGAGRFATSVLNLPEAITNPEELETQEIPFWRKVVGGIGDRQTQETFYQHLNDVKYAKREIDAIYKMGITTEEGQERLRYVAQRYPVAVKMLRDAYPNFATTRGMEDLDKDRILSRLRNTIEPTRPTNAEPRGRMGQRRAITSVLTDARKEIKRLEARPDMPAQERRQRIGEQEKLIRDSLIEFNHRWNEVEDSTLGERHQGKLIEKLGPLINGKSPREQTGALRKAGYQATADLLASLPSTPDRFAREFFEIEAARESA